MMRQRTPMKRSAWNTKPSVPKGPGLAQRVAQSLGVALKHERAGPSVFRSRSHRKNVAALDCLCCGRAKRSQAAHLNLLALGKGGGLKVSDAFLIPLCADELGRRGCHRQLDQGGVYDKGTSPTLQIGWLHQTRDRLIALGQWPDEAEADVVRLVGAYLARA